MSKHSVPRRPALSAFVALFLASLAVALIEGSKPFYFDSGNYWQLAETFGVHGSFSLLNFEYTGLRGFALPLTYFLMMELGGLLGFGQGFEVTIFNAVLFALIGGVLGPRLAEIAWPQQRWGIVRRLLLGALLLVFWSGYLSFPLSDFPALGAALLALVAISRAGSPAAMAVAGLAASYAVNARPAYLLLIPLTGALILWGWWRPAAGVVESAARRAACLACFVLGLLIVMVPQAIVDHHASGGASPLPGGNDLAGLQYTEGLRLQRYETFVGPAPRMEYVDPDTGSILAGLDGGVVSDTPQYVEIIASHPITMAGVFLRHVVNGLDQRYTTPYVERLEPPSRKILRGAGFLLVFLALFRLSWTRGRRSLGPAKWRYQGALLLCCATSLPSAIETRFLLPVFILSGLVVLAPGWPNPIEASEPGWRRYRTVAIGCLALAAYLVLVGVVVSGATDNLRLA